VAGAVAGRRRGALCSGLPEDRLRAGMGSGGGGGAPGAPSRRGETPPWLAGDGHGGLPPPMVFLAGGAGIWGFGGAGSARREGEGPRARSRPPACPPPAGRRSCCSPAVRAPGRQKQGRRPSVMGKRREGEGKKEKKSEGVK